MRSGPDTRSAVVRVLRPGEAARFAGSQGDWYRVRLPGGGDGWVASWVARLVYDEPVPARVRADVLNVRAGPGLDFPAVRSLRGGSGVTVTAAAGVWREVRLADGAVGWVHGAYLDLPALSAPDGGTPLPEPPSPVETPSAPPEPRPGWIPDPRPTAQPGGSPPAGASAPGSDTPGDGRAPPSAAPTAPAPTAALPPATIPPAAVPPATVPGPAAGPDPAAYRLPSERESTPAGPPKSVTLQVAEAVLRTGRSDRYGEVDRVKAGEPLAYVTAREGWVRVQSPRGRQGWLPGPAVRLREPGGDPLTGPVYALAEEAWSVSWPPLLQVVPADGLRLRQSPDLGAPVLGVLAPGTALSELERKGDWVRVRLPDGSTGWVAAAYVRPGLPAGVAVTSVQLRRTAPGVMRLELAGALAGARVAEEEGALRVALPGAPRGGGGAYLPVGAGPVEAVEAAPDGVRVTWQQAPPYWRVLESTPARLVLEIRPAVTELTWSEEGPDRVLSVRVRGHVQPRTGYEGGALLLSLPGAVLDGARVPADVQAIPGTDALTLRVPTASAFALRSVPDGFRVVLYGPGLARRRIALDPGHGGGDPGAQNPALGLKEKDITLAIARRVAALLAARGAEVRLTRDGDAAALPPSIRARVPAGESERAELDYRTYIANQWGADLFLSIHANAGGPQAGTETYWSAQNYNADRSRRLAGLIQAELVTALGRPDRGVKEALFYVVRHAEAPAALAEVAFLSNPEEARLLADPAFQQRAAEALVRAVQRFFESP